MSGSQEVQELGVESEGSGTKDWKSEGSGTTDGSPGCSGTRGWRLTKS